MGEKNNPSQETFMYTNSGRKFDFSSFSPSDLNLGDIAHSLSRIPRFNGHSDIRWNVMQHSTLVAALVPKELELEALLHDASEAYTGDNITPLKNFCPELKVLEQRINSALEEKWKLDFSSPKLNSADLTALILEAVYLFQSKDSDNSSPHPIAKWATQNIPLGSLPHEKFFNAKTAYNTHTFHLKLIRLARLRSESISTSKSPS